MGDFSRRRVHLDIKNIVELMTFGFFFVPLQAEI